MRRTSLWVARSRTALANIPGFKIPEAFGMSISIASVRVVVSRAGFIRVTFPGKTCPGKASTLTLTGSPILKYRISFSGTLTTILTIWVSTTVKSGLELAERAAVVAGIVAPGSTIRLKI